MIFDNGPGSAPSTLVAAFPAAFELPPGSARILEIQYTACAFGTPNKTRFKYRLAGLDANWVEVGAARKAYYANLRPGAYRFIVVAANSHGVWNQTGATVNLRLVPYFHETGWFYLLCGLALAGAALLAYQWRTAEIHQRHQLENEMALLKERQRIAKDLHDGLGANLTQVAMLADLASQTPADPQSAQQRFQKLSRSTREALQAVRDIIWSAQPSNDSLESLALRICQYAENLCPTGQPHCHFDLPIPFPSVTLSARERQQILYAAKEALNNVARHAAATRVSVRVRVDPSAFQIEVEDNGRGFDQAGFLSSGSSDFHGLHTMRERAESIGGQFRLDSHPGRGTIIAIQVPLSKAHDYQGEHS